MERNEDMIYSGTRHPFLGEYKAGFTKDGVLTCLELELFCNSGYSCDLSIGVCYPPPVSTSLSIPPSVSPPLSLPPSLSPSLSSPLICFISLCHCIIGVRQSPDTLL